MPNETQTTKHTPGEITASCPYTAAEIAAMPSDDREYGENLRHFKAGIGFAGLSRFPEFVGFDISGVITEADAQRIKLCWDTHDALIQALRDGLDTLSALSHGMQCGRPFDVERYKATVTAMSTAIALGSAEEIEAEESEVEA